MNNPNSKFDPRYDEDHKRRTVAVMRSHQHFLRQLSRQLGACEFEGRGCGGLEVVNHQRDVSKEGLSLRTRALKHFTQRQEGLDWRPARRLASGGPGRAGATLTAVGRALVVKLRRGRVVAEGDLDVSGRWESKRCSGRLQTDQASHRPGHGHNCG